MNPEKVEYHFIKSGCWLFQVVRNNNMFWDLRWQSWPSESVGKGRRLGSCLRIKEPDLTEDWDIFYNKMTTPSGGLPVTWPFPITFLSVLPSCFAKNSPHSLSPGVIASRWGAIQHGAWLSIVLSVRYLLGWGSEPGWPMWQGHRGRSKQYSSHHGGTDM